MPGFIPKTVWFPIALIAIWLCLFVLVLTGCSGPSEPQPDYHGFLIGKSYVPAAYTSGVAIGEKGHASQVFTYHPEQWVLITKCGERVETFSVSRATWGACHEGDRARIRPHWYGNQLVEVTHTRGD